MQTREQEIYRIISPLIQGYTEGIYWDFKQSLFDVAGIIKDVLAFSNSSYNGDSYIIVGISAGENTEKVALDTNDRRRLNTDENFLYTPGTWDIHGISAAELKSMRDFSAKLTEKLAASMLISQPELEFVPISLQNER